MDGDEVGAEVERDAEQARQAGGEAPRGDARVGLDHGDGADAGVATGKQSGKGNQLRAQDDRSFEGPAAGEVDRSEEHTSELQSLMRISYAVFCLKKKRKTQLQTNAKTYPNSTQNTNRQRTE